MIHLSESPCFHSWGREEFSEHPRAQVTLALWLRWLSAEYSWQCSFLPAQREALAYLEQTHFLPGSRGWEDASQNRDGPLSHTLVWDRLWSFPNLDGLTVQLFIVGFRLFYLNLPNLKDDLLGPLKTSAHLKRQCCPKHSPERLTTRELGLLWVITSS